MMLLVMKLISHVTRYQFLKHKGYVLCTLHIYLLGKVYL